ncbi:MAG: monovalent cation/H(+) antiporter subunit G [Gammaproteobacteria bacterium]|nr:monovalent cation/H(+) antiporter subunit G [Gammaproteobacteria bacterium]
MRSATGHDHPDRGRQLGADRRRVVLRPGRGIGVLRMPDFYTRLHGSSLTDSLGTFAVLFGLMLQFGLSLATLKLVAIALFLYLTNPTAAYALAHAALLADVPGLASRPHEES